MSSAWSSSPWNKPSTQPPTQPHPVTSSLRDIMNEQAEETKSRETAAQTSRRVHPAGVYGTGATSSDIPQKTFTFTDAGSHNKFMKKSSFGTTVVNVRVRHLRQIGYKDLVEWTKDPNNVYIGRNMTHYVPGAVGSMWQNPFKDKEIGRDECVRRYKEYIKTDKKIQSNGRTLLESLDELKGKTLGCWCHPERCHGHALVELLEEYSTDK